MQDVFTGPAAPPGARATHWPLPLTAGGGAALLAAGLAGLGFLIPGVSALLVAALVATCGVAGVGLLAAGLWSALRQEAPSPATPLSEPAAPGVSLTVPPPRVVTPASPPPPASPVSAPSPPPVRVPSGFGNRDQSCWLNAGLASLLACDSFHQLVAAAGGAAAADPVVRILARLVAAHADADVATKTQLAMQLRAELPASLHHGQEDAAAGIGELLRHCGYALRLANARQAQVEGTTYEWSDPTEDNDVLEYLGLPPAADLQAALARACNQPNTDARNQVRVDTADGVRRTSTWSATMRLRAAPPLLVTRWNDPAGIAVPLPGEPLDITQALAPPPAAPVRYRLVARLVHTGAGNKAHYVADVRVGEGWYRYDDHRVRAVESRAQPATLLVWERLPAG